MVAAATAAAAGHSLGQNVSALAEEGPNTEPEGVGYGIAIGQLILRLRLYPLIRADSRKHKQQARKGSWKNQGSPAWNNAGLFQNLFLTQLKKKIILVSVGVHFDSD